MKPIYEILPEDNNLTNSDLLIVQGDDTISFVIKDWVKNQLLGIAVYSFDNSDNNYYEQLKELIGTRKVLSTGFREAKLIYDTHESTLVPDELFNQDDIADYLNLMFGLSGQNMELNHDKFNELPYYNCYRVKEGLYEFFKQNFDIIQANHIYSTWVEKFTAGPDKVYLTIQSGSIRLAVFKDEKCLLINKYPYRTTEDITYRVLAALQQNGIEQLPVEVAGYIEKESNSFLDLKKYFKDVVLASLNEDQIGNSDLNVLPGHYFSHLFELSR